MQQFFTFLAPRNLNQTTLELFFSLNQRLMPQSHTHLRTLRMISPSATIRSFRNDTYLIRRERNSSYLIRNLPQGTFHPRPNFEKYQKSSADENNAKMRNAWQEYVIMSYVLCSDFISEF